VSKSAAAIGNYKSISRHSAPIGRDKIAGKKKGRIRGL